MLLWLEALAVAGLILALLGRHRFPFAAPATTWLGGAVLSFADGRLIVDNDAMFVAGMGAALLLGNLREVRKARLGLAIVLGSAATVVYNGPERAAGQLVFTPLLFALAWLVGFALRERAAQSEAAEERAMRAERERESAARVAVAEERGRIARELHDVVAHAVSVMVLQIGAVRHRMPPTDTEDRDALRNVEQAGRTALAEMRRLLNAMRNEGDDLELLPHPGLDDLDALVGRRTGDRPGRGGTTPRRAGRRCRPASTSRRTGSSRRASPTPSSTPRREHAPGRRALRPRGPPARGPRRRRRARRTGTNGAGHGLVGIGERVKIYGGEMTAGAGRTGGFLLRVRLPLDDGGDA